MAEKENAKYYIVISSDMIITNFNLNPDGGAVIEVEDLETDKCTCSSGVFVFPAEEYRLNPESIKQFKSNSDK